MKKIIFFFFVGLCIAFPSADAASKAKAEPYVKDYNAGVEAQKKHDYPAAIQYYQQALEQKSDFSDAWNNLGYCYRMVAKSYMAKAGDAYDKALRYHPKHAEALEYQGEYFVMTGQLNYAYHNYQVLKQMQSDEADVLREKLDIVLKQAQSVLKSYTP